MLQALAIAALVLIVLVLWDPHKIRTTNKDKQ